MKWMIFTLGFSLYLVPSLCKVYRRQIKTKTWLLFCISIIKNGFKHQVIFEYLVKMLLWALIDKWVNNRIKTLLPLLSLPLYLKKTLTRRAVPLWIPPVKHCVWTCGCITHCIGVPDPLEGEPFPEAHPAPLSKRRKPSDCLIYITEPQKHNHSCALTEFLQDLSRTWNLCRQLTWMEP